MHNILSELEGEEKNVAEDRKKIEAIMKGVEWLKREKDTYEEKHNVEAITVDAL